ncbi:hypothetical protein [Microcoleus sp. MON2_D5]|uniref:hypothetical protein n=1 Tax=Microcoleus sp. MON2_D5 TaxID=2818833 RepID=UPI002FD4280F
MLKKTSPHKRSAQFSDGSTLRLCGKCDRLDADDPPCLASLPSLVYNSPKRLKSLSLWVYTALIAYWCDRPALPHPTGWRSAINLVYS